jgi:hypothetical protein
MDAIGAEFRRELETFGRAGFDAQPTAFAFFDVDRYSTTR